MKFTDLWVGDRFTAYGDLWTKLDHKTARQHRKASIALGAKGAGYIGDTICSFDRGDAVEFQAPQPIDTDTAKPFSTPEREERYTFWRKYPYYKAIPLDSDTSAMLADGWQQITPDEARASMRAGQPFTTERHQ